MSRRKSPYIVKSYWLEKRRGGDSPSWQIAWNDHGEVRYRSTRTADLSKAKGIIEAFVEKREAEKREPKEEQNVPRILISYWREKALSVINGDQTQRSFFTFIAFLGQDAVGVGAKVTDLTPALFERFRKWRMGPHEFEIEWFGNLKSYNSPGVAGSTVQRNLNDIRAAVYHARNTLKIRMAPKIRNLDSRYQSAHRSRILTEEELARIAWFASHNKQLFRFVTLQISTAVRPMAARQFDPNMQYDDARGMIDLHPDAAPQTKKRNAILPAIRPIRPILRAWAADDATLYRSHRTDWRTMREVLDLDDDVVAKTIRYTIATWLYEMEWVPERQISEMLGHTAESSSGMARTSRIYAKYRPERMGKLVRALEVIWMRLSRQARKYGTVHSLTTVETEGRKQLKICSKRPLNQ